MVVRTSNSTHVVKLDRFIGRHVCSLRMSTPQGMSHAKVTLQSSE